MKYIDIFAGCGGLSLGLLNSGWKGIFAIEKDTMAFETLQHNLIKEESHFSWPRWLKKTNHDIDELVELHSSRLKQLRGTIDLVAGGPPCQGFSTAGRRQECDARNKLIHSYIRFVEIVRPRAILFENVKGFAQSFHKTGKQKKPYSEIVITGLRNLGYGNVEGRLIDFSKFGIPQARERFIIVGTMEGETQYFFDLLKNNKSAFLASKGLRACIGVGAAISDLNRQHGEIDCPDSEGFKSGVYISPRNNYQRLLRGKYNNGHIPDSHRFVNHRPTTIRMYKKLLKSAPRNITLDNKTRAKFGVNKRDISVLDSKKPSPTLMSIPDDHVHYCEPRVLTVREYARVQSFPDWFEVRGNYTTGGKQRAMEVPRYTQIANAIPPLFAEHIGNALMELLD